MSYVLLKNVDTTSQNWCVMVRVVRFCDFLISSQEAPTRQRTDFIVVDEEGTAMEGQVHESWHKRTATPLLENHVYIIKHFYVSAPRPSYRVVEHVAMMRFTQYTKITEVTQNLERFPLYVHAAVSFEVLASRINKDEVLSDTFGIITGCSHLKEQSTKLGIKKLRNVRLSNGSDQITITLWGHHAEIFDAEEYVRQSQQETIVFLFCGLTCRVFNDKLAPQSSYLCRWYANPDLSQTMHLKQSFGNLGPAIWLDAKAPTVDAEDRTVAQLSTCNPHEIHHMRFNVKAKIRSVETKQSWWYMACTTCNKKINAHAGVHKCSNPVCANSIAAPRYCLVVEAVDPWVAVSSEDTPSVHLVFFGPTAEEVIGAPVHEVMKEDIQKGSSFPPRINNVCGKSFSMRVSLSRFSYNPEEHISYQVNRILGVYDDSHVPSVTDDIPSGTAYPLLTKNEATTMSEDVTLKVNDSLNEKAPEAAADASTPQDPAIDVPAIGNPEDRNLPITPTTPAVLEATKAGRVPSKQPLTELQGGQVLVKENRSATVKRKLEYNAGCSTEKQRK